MALQGKRVLITGGAGFIGSHLADGWSTHNHVVLYDNLTRDALRTPASRRTRTSRWCAATSSTRGARARPRRARRHRPHGLHRRRRHRAQEPGRDHAGHLLGTDNALEAAREQARRCERFIDFSTSEVFGALRLPRRPSSTRRRCGAVGEARWTYAVAKLATEHLAHNYHKEIGLPTCVDPARSTSTARARWARAPSTTSSVRALAGEPLIIHNDGSQIRAWCYIDDIVDAILRDPRERRRGRPGLQHRQPALGRAPSTTWRAHPAAVGRRARRSSSGRCTTPTSRSASRTSTRRASCSAGSRRSTSTRGSCARSSGTGAKGGEVSDRRGAWPGPSSATRAGRRSQRVLRQPAT